MKTITALFVLGAMVWLFEGCKTDNSGSTSGGASTTGGTSTTGTTPPKQEKFYQIDKDSAYAFVEAQVKFGPRVPGTVQHQRCVKYLKTTLARFADTVVMNQGPMRNYTGQTLIMQNIVGSFNPKATKRVLLAAHYDTRPKADEDPTNPSKPADGANDGASGVGVLLEIARQLSIERPKVGIDIIFFDAEDGGMRNGASETWCLGSQYWAANPHVPIYTARYGILLDMVGAADAKFGYELYSINTAQGAMLKVWNMAQRLGHGNHFLNVRGSSITDDHVFVNQGRGIPMIDIIDYDAVSGRGFGDFWHTHNDNIDVIDANTLNAVGETVLNVVMRE